MSIKVDAAQPYTLDRSTMLPSAPSQAFNSTGSTSFNNKRGPTSIPSTTIKPPQRRPQPRQNIDSTPSIRPPLLSSSQSHASNLSNLSTTTTTRAPRRILIPSSRPIVNNRREENQRQGEETAKEETPKRRAARVSKDNTASSPNVRRSGGGVVERSETIDSPRTRKPQTVASTTTTTTTNRVPSNTLRRSVTSRLSSVSDRSTNASLENTDRTNLVPRSSSSTSTLPRTIRPVARRLPIPSISSLSNLPHPTSLSSSTSTSSIPTSRIGGGGIIAGSSKTLPRPISSRANSNCSGTGGSLKLPSSSMGLGRPPSTVSTVKHPPNLYHRNVSSSTSTSRLRTPLRNSTRLSSSTTLKNSVRGSVRRDNIQEDREGDMGTGRHSRRESWETTSSNASTSSRRHRTSNVSTTGGGGPESPEGFLFSTPRTHRDHSFLNDEPSLLNVTPSLVIPSTVRPTNSNFGGNGLNELSPPPPLNPLLQSTRSLSHQSYKESPLSRSAKNQHPNPSSTSTTSVSNLPKPRQLHLLKSSLSPRNSSTSTSSRSSPSSTRPSAHSNATTIGTPSTKRQERQKRVARDSTSLEEFLRIGLASFQDQQQHRLHSSSTSPRGVEGGGGGQTGGKLRLSSLLSLVDEKTSKLMREEFERDLPDELKESLSRSMRSAMEGKVEVVEGREKEGDEERGGEEGELEKLREEKMELEEELEQLRKERDDEVEAREDELERIKGEMERMRTEAIERERVWREERNRIESASSSISSQSLGPSLSKTSTSPLPAIRLDITRSIANYTRYRDTSTTLASMAMDDQFELASNLDALKTIGQGLNMWNELLCV